MHESGRICSQKLYLYSLISAMPASFVFQDENYSQTKIDDLLLLVWIKLG